MTALRRLGLLVHPTRKIDKVLKEIGDWASARGLSVGQVMVAGQSRRVANPVDAAETDLLVSVGGDGTALTALHSAAPWSRPVLAIACGSIGALTSVSADRVGWALDQIEAGQWTPVPVPGLEMAWGEQSGGVAINDIVIVRDGPGQIAVGITVDDVPYCRLAGDGLVVATALGSSAYNIAAGGPLLAPGAEGMAVTPLAAHGGFCPPLVTGSASRVALTIQPGYGGARCEVDGDRARIEGRVLTLRHRPDYATLVRLAGEESRLTGLRRRGLVVDSPRLLIREEAAERRPAQDPPSS